MSGFPGFAGFPGFPPFPGMGGGGGGSGGFPQVDQMVSVQGDAMSREVSQPALDLDLHNTSERGLTEHSFQLALAFFQA